jgi:prepilin peptidase CpaA
MPALDLPSTILIACLALFTAVCAVTDLRTRKIPNKLTLPAFALGLVYQFVFHPHGETIWLSLFDAGKAFSLGFGALFILWLIGGGGGGDAKLMGALSVWLGWKMTVWVLVLSTVFVLIGTFAVVFYGVIARGARKTKQLYTSKTLGNPGKGTENTVDKSNRRIMTYAFPVALATWLVLFWFHLKPHV